MLSRRAYFIFRTLFGVLILIEVFERISLYPFLFGPYAFLRNHLMSADVANVGWKILLGVQLLSALGIFLGVRARLCAVIQLLCLQIAHAHFALIRHGGDTYLILACVWVALLPAELSLRRWREVFQKKEVWRSTTTSLLIVHFAMTYLVAGFCKDVVWQTDNVALAVLKNSVWSSYPLWNWDQLSGLLRAATLFTLWSECVVPIIFLLFVRKRMIRNMIAAFFFVGHFVSFLLLNLGVMPLICMLFWAAIYQPKDEREVVLQENWRNIRVWIVTALIVATTFLLIAYGANIWESSRLRLVRVGMAWTHFMRVSPNRWEGFWIHLSVQNADGSWSGQDRELNVLNRRVQRAVLRLIEGNDERQAKKRWARYLCLSQFGSEEIGKLEVLGRRRPIGDEMAGSETLTLMFTDCAKVKELVRQRKPKPE